MLTKKQKKMLEALAENYVNVSKATRIMGISRETHYYWLDTSAQYKEKYEELKESLLDLAEEKLMINIDEAKEASIFFFLKTKGKDRGYVERQEIDAKVTNIPTMDEFYDE
jgi:hypothetical protein